MENNLLAQSSALYQIIYSFSLGFLSSFTPCVFPLIPVTLALFGIKKDTSRGRRFALSLSYVFGIAATYTLLGMLSAKTGMIFGSLLGNAYFLILVVVFLILLSLYTLEIVNFSFTARIQTMANKMGGEGLLGAFIMGTVSGLVAAPCIGPALILILGLAASSQSILWGASLLFTYSLGLGIIFLTVGTFSGLLHRLPRSGNWMQAVKFLIAASLMIVVAFLVERYTRDFYVAADFNKNMLIFLVVQNFSLLLAYQAYRHSFKWRKFLAVILFSFSTYPFIFALSKIPVISESAGTEELHWITDLKQAVNTAHSNGKILMVDLYADWCTACKEMDAKTFSDKLVKNKLNEFTLARIDFTDAESEVAQTINEKYGIPGLPCILFLSKDGSGREIIGSRITGYLNANDFLTHLATNIKSE